jgi:hypothetical protein
VPLAAPAQDARQRTSPGRAEPRSPALPMWRSDALVGDARDATSAPSCWGRKRRRLSMWLAGQRGKSKPAPVRARLWSGLPLANTPDQPHHESGVRGVRCRSSPAVGSRRGREPRMGCSISGLALQHSHWRRRRLDQRAPSTSSTRSERSASALSTSSRSTRPPARLRCRDRQA